MLDSYFFSESSEKKFLKLQKMFPDKRSMVIPALWLVQKDKGFLDRQSMEYVVERIGKPVSLAHVYGVATFYTLFNKEKIGKYHIQLCSTSSCFLSNSEQIKEAICKKLNIESGDTTKDQKFTFTEVECLGACGYAPMVQINDKYYENLTVEKINHIIEHLE